MLLGAIGYQVSTSKAMKYPSELQLILARLVAKPR